MRTSGNIYGKGAKGKAMRLHSLIIRSRGACENCGRTSPLDAAHIVTRSRARTASDLGNAMCLCKKCHIHFTAWPLEWTKFVVGKIGWDAYEELVARSQQTKPKVDWDAEVERLAAICKELGIETRKS